MQDPPAENIEGVKRVAHTVEHRIDWGHVMIGVGLLALALVFRRVFTPNEEDSRTGGVPAN